MWSWDNANRLTEFYLFETVVIDRHHKSLGMEYHMLYRNSILFIVLLISSASAARQQAIAPLVADDLLEQAGLHQIWQTKLAVNDGERIERLRLLGDKIYALTSDNYLVCLNRNSGKLVFGMQLVSPGFPVLEPTLYDNQLLIVAGNRLMQIDPARGATDYTLKFSFTAVCPAVRNSQNIYAAGTDRRVHAINAADRVPVFAVEADNESLPTSVLATEEYVAFTTDKGNILSITPGGPKRLWQFDTMAKISVPLVSDANSLYAASDDTRLYRLAASTGRQIWKYQCGGMPKNSPRVTQKTVYQYVLNQGVAAVSKDSGKEMWTVDNGTDLLAEIGSRAYIMTDGRTVAVVDNTTYKQLFTINFSQTSLEAANAVDGKIYVADCAGRVACITAVK
jgi:outer membrane protein assembly factor BamB